MTNPPSPTSEAQRIRDRDVVHQALAATDTHAGKLFYLSVMLASKNRAYREAALELLGTLEP